MSVLGFIFTTNAQMVSTLAGTTTGYLNGNGTVAKFNNPSGITTDLLGNVYVSDCTNQKIRKITPSGVVTTFAGSTEGNSDGSIANARFSYPQGLVFDSTGNLFVADGNNKRIRKITPNGIVSTLAGSTQGYADGVGTDAKFGHLMGITIDSSDNLYVVDRGNSLIRKITPTGVVTTFAGSTLGYVDGIGTSAQFNYPHGITIDQAGNLYVNDSNNFKIRKITPDGTVSTLAGSTYGDLDGVGTQVQFTNLFDITVDINGDLYVADCNNFKIRKITPDGTVSTLAGSNYGYADGIGTLAQFKNPSGITIDTNGNMYVSDYFDEKIRKITDFLSVNENESIKINIYPNPTSDVLRIQLPDDILLLDAFIYNTQGQLIKRDKQNDINISDLSSGNYFVKVISNQGENTKGFIIK